MECREAVTKEKQCIHNHMYKDPENAVLKEKKKSIDIAHCININLKCITKLYCLSYKDICLYILVGAYIFLDAPIYMSGVSKNI